MTRYPSFGATLAVDFHGGTTYRDIAQVRDIGGPTIGRESIEVPPDHDQPDNYKEFFPGVADAGELTFAINLDPESGTHVGAMGSGLLGSFEQVKGTGLPRWRFQGPGMSSGTAMWVFRGFITAMDFDTGAVEGSMAADLTVKVSAKPTFTCA